MIDADKNFVVTNWAGNGKGLCISRMENFTNHSTSIQLCRAMGMRHAGYERKLLGRHRRNMINRIRLECIGYEPLMELPASFQAVTDGKLGPAIEGTQYVNAILTDQDDGIWCGTEGGVEIISNPESILQNRPNIHLHPNGAIHHESGCLLHGRRWRGK